MSSVIGKNRIFKKGLIFTFIGGVTMALAFALTLDFSNILITAAISAVLGFVMLPVLPLSYDFGCELTYPVGEAMTGGLLNVGGMIWALLQIIITTLLLDWILVANLVAPMCLAVGLVFTLLLKHIKPTDVKLLSENTEAVGS
jgi:FLVCR family feline leukemia virus subgroup C receptor-related protein